MASAWLGDVESDTTFLEDVTDLREEVVDDLYVRKFARRGTPQFTRAEAMAIARTAIDNPAAPVEPADAPENSIAALRVSLAGAARRELDARKRRTGVMTYDDLLTRLERDARQARAAGSPRRGCAPATASCSSTSSRTPTPSSGGSPHGVRRRGGDARAHRRPEAGDLRLPRRRRLRLHRGGAHAGAQATLPPTGAATRGCSTPTTRCSAARSSGTRGSSTGGRGSIGTATARCAGRRAAADPGRAARRARTHRRAPRASSRRETRRRATCRRHRRAAALRRRDRGRGRVRPGHIAVLVRTNRNAARVREALEAVEVPAVINGAGSVFGTEPARSGCACSRRSAPSYPPRARSAALTTIVGWTTEEVAAADDDAWEECTGACITGRACCARRASRR